MIRRLARRPLGLALRHLNDVRLRRLYGVRRPGWWPRDRGWPLGPGGEHDGKPVVVTLGDRRFVFLPVSYGRYRGHVHRGGPCPGPSDLAGRLERLGLPPALGKVFAATSRIEGGFDAIQTCDRTRFVWGFIQFAATGGLPRLLQSIKAAEPALFDARFASAGIDVERGRIRTRRGARILRGLSALNELHDEPRLWTCFLLAGRDEPIRDLQVKAAYEQYYRPMLERTLALPFGTVRLGALFESDELARAILFDRAVHQGIGSALALFERAARRTSIRSPDEAFHVLEAAVELAPQHRARFDAIRAAFDA